MLLLLPLLIAGCGTQSYPALEEESDEELVVTIQELGKEVQANEQEVKLWEDRVSFTKMCPSFLERQEQECASILTNQELFFKYSSRSLCP